MSKYRIDFVEEGRIEFVDCVRFEMDRALPTKVVMTTVIDRTATDHRDLELDLISFGTTGEAIAILKRYSIFSGDGTGPTLSHIMVTELSDN